MSEPIKLKEAGEKHTMDVARCRLLPFGNDPEIEYEGRDGSKVWVPQKSSDRQLARLNLTMESVVGRRVTLKRDANSTKGRPPFWGIYLEDSENGNGTGGVRDRTVADAPTTGNSSVPKSAASAQHASASVTSQSPAPAPSGHELYAKITAWVLKEIVPQYKAVGIQPTQEGTAAICATLFIAKNGRH